MLIELSVLSTKSYFYPMYRAVILLLTFLIVLASCQDNKQKSVQEVSRKHVTLQDGLYYQEGHLFSGVITNDKPTAALIHKEEITVRKGLMDGPMRQWLANGVLRTEKNYRASVEDGKQIGYHTDGKLSYEYETKFGKKDGVYKEYYPSGLPHIEVYYQQGIIVGKKILDRNGVTLTNYRIKDGRYYGLLGSNSCINVLNENDEIEE